jgi:acetyltransferase-like isoleucine patch superfamily enzyme
MIKEKIKKYLPVDSVARWIFAGIYHSGPLFLFQLARSFHASYRLTGKFVSLRVRVGRGQQIRITRESSSKINLIGFIQVDNWEGASAPSSIRVGENSTLSVLGNLSIGPGVHITVGPNATLAFGGKSTSSGSGITANCRIMVEKLVSLGKDCIVAWDTFITDSDHHNINGNQRIAPVIIGDNVWISHGVSILKGSCVPNGCIVAAKALVLSDDFNENCLIGGIPATILKRGVSWTR